MPFLSLNNADVEFAEPKKHTWKSYKTVKDLLITSQVKFIDKKKFAKIA